MQPHANSVPSVEHVPRIPPAPSITAAYPRQPSLRDYEKNIRTHRLPHNFRREFGLTPVIEETAGRNRRIGNPRDNAAGKLACAQPFLKRSVHEQLHLKRLLL